METYPWVRINKQNGINKNKWDPLHFGEALSVLRSDYPVTIYLQFWLKWDIAFWTTASRVQLELGGNILCTSILKNWFPIREDLGANILLSVVLIIKTSLLWPSFVIVIIRRHSQNWIKDSLPNVDFLAFWVHSPLSTNTLPFPRPPSHNALACKLGYS